MRPAGQSEGSKTNEKSDFLARATYGQWLAAQLYGDVLDDNPRHQPRKNPNRINLVAQKLVSANASSNPTYIFDDKAPSLLARLFNLGPARFNPTKQIQAHLVRVVQEANEVIANILPSERYIDEDIGIEMSLACPNYNAHYSGYIVYVSVPIELPFEPFEASDALKTAADVDVAPISQDWLEAVGADLCKPVSLLP